MTRLRFICVSLMLAIGSAFRFIPNEEKRSLAWMEKNGFSVMFYKFDNCYHVNPPWWVRIPLLGFEPVPSEKGHQVGVLFVQWMKAQGFELNSYLVDFDSWCQPHTKVEGYAKLTHKFKAPWWA